MGRRSRSRIRRSPPTPGRPAPGSEAARPVIRPDSDGRAPWAPWATHDLVRLIAFVAAGCAVAWTGASAHAALRDQTGWIVLGVAAFGVAVVGQSLWLRQGRRAV